MLRPAKCVRLPVASIVVVSVWVGVRLGSGFCVATVCQPNLSGVCQAWGASMAAKWLLPG